jgi:hypothetical protein
VNFQANNGLIIGGGESFGKGHQRILTELRNERKGKFEQKLASELAIFYPWIVKLALHPLAIRDYKRYFAYRRRSEVGAKTLADFLNAAEEAKLKIGRNPRTWSFAPGGRYAGFTFGNSACRSFI